MSGIPNSITNFQMFVAGHLYDPNCNYQDLPKDVIGVISVASSLNFECNDEFPFDQNGALSFLRSVPASLIEKEQIIPFNLNVNNRGNDDMGDVDYQEKSVNILGQLTSDLFFGYDNDIVLDLQRFRLRPSHISIAHEYYPESYDFQPLIYATNDFNLGMSWIMIHLEEVGEKVFMYEGRKILLRTWEIDINRYFRYIKIENSLRDGILCSGLEMFGHLTYEY
jgi:hypothetical protein